MQPADAMAMRPSQQSSGDAMVVFSNSYARLPQHFFARVQPAPAPKPAKRTPPTDGWTNQPALKPDPALLAVYEGSDEDTANSGLRREPDLPDHVAIVPETTPSAPDREFEIGEDDEADNAARQREALSRSQSGLARQVSLDPDDDMDL